VGSARGIVALEACGQIFLAPDNGLLPDRLLASEGARAVAVDLPQLSRLARLPPPSATFHGRDVFAPLAAGLASGALELAALGPPATPLASALPAPVTDDEAVHGAVITVDRFGNLITNLERASVEAEHARYVLLGERPVPLVRTYADAAPGDLVALIDAFEVVEIARRDGSAERHLGLGRGTPVRVPRHGQLLRA